LDGPAADSLFHQPSGIAVGPGGALYVADGGTNGVRVISAGGRVSTLAASTGFYSVSASQFGTNRLFYQSSALAVDPAGNLYVADTANNTVREITASGSVLTIAGSPGLSGTADGTNGSARFASPVSIAVDARTNLWIADAWSDTLRKITALGGNWVVSTVGGLANVPGCTDASGSAARFYRPEGVALDLSGNLYVADTGNNTIRVGQAVTAGVVLQWSRRADAVVLVWPASATGFTLETSSNVASSGGWTPVTNAPPAPVGGAFTFTNAPGAPAGFFRLRHD
jgi:sugar lactone lactonase YvrE